MHEQYMRRAIFLASLGSGWVWSNPLVGAVLVHNETIIGEGYHARYGGAHAEINCLSSVKEEHRHLICESTMYVTLEPCSHFGKTPPCANRIAEEKISHVVIGSPDFNRQVNGKGVAILEAAGIQVTIGVLQNECIQLNKAFVHFHQHAMPYITLKWAQTSDGFIAPHKQGNYAVSGELTKRFVHQLRATHMGIMIGYRTALLDDPSLSLRYAKGLSPIRIVADRLLSLPGNLNIFDGQQPTIVLHDDKLVAPTSKNASVTHRAFKGGEHQIQSMLTQLATEGITSILVEGGAALLNRFIEAGRFNQAVVITATALLLEKGVASPKLSSCNLQRVEHIGTDLIEVYNNNGNINF